MKSSMTFVNFAVLATMSASLSLVRINSTAGSKRRMYLRSFASHTVKPGTTAASVRRAMRARPLAVSASRGFPQVKGGNSGGSGGRENGGGPVGGAGGDAEKFYEHPLGGG